jgi:hypothetical protein
MNFFNNCIFKLLKYTIKFVIDYSFNCLVFFNLILIFNNRKCLILRCFCKKSINYFHEIEIKSMMFWCFFLIFRRYAFKKNFDEKNLVFIIKINMFANFKNFSIFSYKSIVDTLIRRWISSSNQRWIARHYLLTRLIHSTRLIIIISI